MLHTVDRDGVIRYTLDGTEPSVSSTLYSGPLTLTRSTTIRARSFRNEYGTSSVVTFLYTTRLPSPAFSPPGGDFETAPLVALINTSGEDEVTIRYTDDGTEPTAASPTYMGPIQARGYITIQARAFKDGWAPSPIGAAAYFPNGVPSDPTQVQVSMPGSPETRLMHVEDSVAFDFEGGVILTDPTTVRLYRNGQRVPQTAYSISPSSVTLASGVLLEGQNQLEVEAIDEGARLVTGTTTVWAGRGTATVTVSTEFGRPLFGATVVASVDSRSSVTVSGTTDSFGRVTLRNLPTVDDVRLTVTADGHRAHELFVSPSFSAFPSTEVSLEFGTDFAFGVDGWALSAPSQAIIVPYDRDSQPGGVGDAVRLNRNMRIWDSATRTFTPPPDATEVSVRYRYVMDQTFAGDWFRLSLGSQATGGSMVADWETVQDLVDEDAIGPRGYTEWRTLTLPIENDDELVEVAALANNAIPTLRSSYVEIDDLHVTTYGISVELRDLIDPMDTYAHARVPLHGPLRRFSASRTDAFDGIIRVNGTLHATGAPDDALESVFLEVIEHGRVRGTGELSEDVRQQVLGRRFGADGVRVREQGDGITPVLFEIPGSEFQRVDQTMDDSLRMRVRARTEYGQEVTFLIPGSFVKLVSYTGQNRYGNRDIADCTGLLDDAEDLLQRPPVPCGSDSWGRPSTVAWAASIPGIEWNDFSNMHGGLFPPHRGHMDGRTIDGDFHGYRERNGKSARLLAEALSAGDPDRIDRLLVTYAVIRGSSCKADLNGRHDPRNAFWKAISEYPGIASKVELIGGHCRHFDIRLVEAPNR